MVPMICTTPLVFITAVVDGNGFSFRVGKGIREACPFPLYRS
jgi:hypothetical protein